MGVEVRFTQAARRHRIGKAHALHVMGTAEPPRRIRESGEEELTWTGPDDRGIHLDVVAVIARDTRARGTIILVLHVMPTTLRRRQG